MCNNIEPLAPALWFKRIAVIAAGELASIENSLRHAGHLVQLAPISFRNVLPQIVEEGEFESLLESEGLETAARNLFGPTTTLLIEAPDNGKPVRAVVSCSTLQRTVDGTGTSAAAAMLNAWTRWLMTLRVELGAELSDMEEPAGGWRTPSGLRSCPRAS